MSEEIDSTTISHSEDNEVPLFGVHHNGHELVPGNHSTNNQKRKFSEDDGNSNPESSDESKKQRTNESDYNNAVASVGDSALRTNGDNVNRNEDEATGGESAEEPPAGISIKQEIKEEPQDDNEAESTSSPNEFCDIKLEVKTEASDESENPTAEEATSSIRDSCQYGIKCYRKNPVHRTELAHPGDSDYRRPSYPNPPPGTPDCPFGDRCYRRNPIHFQNLAHPPSS